MATMHTPHINIKRTGERQIYHPRFEQMPRVWHSYSGEDHKLRVNKSCEVYTKASRKHQINMIEYEVDLLNAIAEHFRSLDFVTRYEHAYL